MTISLETLEQFLTDDSDELDAPGWLSNASAEAWSVLYIFARQCGIDVLDLLFVATRCDQLTPFLIRQVLTPEGIPAAQEIIDRIGAKKFSPAEHESVFMLNSWIARETATLKK